MGEIIVFFIGLLIYGTANHFAGILSDKINIPNSIEAISFIIICVGIVVFLNKKQQLEYYGISSLKKLYHKNLLYYIPLLLVASVNLWSGIYIKYSWLQIFLITVCMLCVGFIEEMIFRSFLMKALMNKSNTLALIVSGSLFGVIHLVNLFTGSELLPTILQVFYAMAFGFMCSAFFFKTNNIIPCVICHSLFDVFNTFLPETQTEEMRYFGCAAIILIAGGYTIYLMRTKRKLFF